MPTWQHKALEGWGEAGGRAGLGKGQGLTPARSLPSPEVTHVVMEQTSAEDALCWQKSRAAPRSPGGARPALVDISWFTESMAAGQPVAVECRHRLEVSGHRERPSAGCSLAGPGAYMSTCGGQ